MTPEDQLQLEYAAKTNASIRHVMAELARVQAERDGLRVLLTESLNLGEACARIIVKLTGHPIENDHFATIRKEIAE